MKVIAGVTEGDRSVTVGDRSVTVGNSNGVSLGDRLGRRRKEERVRGTDDPGGSDRGVLLFLLAAGALLSPALQLWVAPGMPWWTLYAVWGAIIALAALAQRRAP
jgi:hypothetical protein